MWLADRSDISASSRRWLHSQQHGRPVRAPATIVGSSAAGVKPFTGTRSPALRVKHVNGPPLDETGRQSGRFIPEATTRTGSAVKVQINSEVCQGHGRCYDLAPKLFGEDDEGYGTVLGDGTVPADQEDAARLAVANCPERAISLTEES